MNTRLLIGAAALIGFALYARKLQASELQYQSPYYPFDPETTDSPLVIPPTEPDAMTFELPPNATRGERNNNPGNIVKSSSPWMGKIAGNDSRFETFDTPQNGIRALAKLISNYINSGIDTIDEIIARYAPSNENNTTAYQSAVSRTTGFPRTMPLTDSPEIVASLVNAIILHENGRNIYASSGIMDQGISMV